MNFVFVILNFVLLCCVRSDDERTLSMQLNPGCSTQLDSTQCEESITFVHIQAESSDNTLHYLWDFTGIPSLMLARTDPNTSLIIDWNNFITGRPGSVVLSSDPSFVFASVIHQFLIFDDAGDKADVNDDKIGEVKQFNPYFFNWSRENLTQANDEVTMSMRAIIDNGDESNGSFVLKVRRFLVHELDSI